MSGRGSSPSSAASSPGGSPRHHRGRQSRAESKQKQSPRTPPRHKHHHKDHASETKEIKASRSKDVIKDGKKVDALRKDAVKHSSPSRSRSASGSRLSTSSVGSGIGVALPCDDGDAAELFAEPVKHLAVSDTNSNKMEERRTSQVSDSGVESMDSDKLKSKVNMEQQQLSGGCSGSNGTGTENKNGHDESNRGAESKGVGLIPSYKEDEHEKVHIMQDSGVISKDQDDTNIIDQEEDEVDAEEMSDAERESMENSPNEDSLEAKYDLLPSVAGKDFLGVLGYRRIDGDKDVMASSIICTDGSDVEALSEVDDNENPMDDNDNEKDSSDSIEILDGDEKHKLRYTSGDNLYVSDTDCSNLETLTKDVDQDQTSPSQEDQDDLDNRDSPVPLPIDAVVELKSTEPGALLGKPSDSAKMSDQDSDSHFDSDTSDGGAGIGGEYLNYEDVMSSLIYGYTKMTDSGIDQFGASGISRPDSLCLPRPMHRRIHRSESNSSSVHSYSSTEALIEAATCTPLHAQGTVDQDGEMIAFVAQDLAEKIRMSSPLTRSSRGDNSSGASYAGGSHTPSGRSVSSVNSMSSSASGWSTSSASGWSALSTSGMSRSPSVLTQSPEDIPPIDPRAVLDLEMNARRVAENLDVMMANMKGSLNKMSALTVNCVGAYKTGIDNTCDSVDGAIKSMYALMAKCEELSKNMKPIYQLADQIKEIKRLLDLFEAQIAREEK